MGKNEAISSKARNETKVSTLIQNSAWILSKNNGQENKIKGIQIGREEVKLLLFEDGLIMYLRDLKDSTKTLLDLAK
jgi:hypothetical protein